MTGALHLSRLPSLLFLSWAPSGVSPGAQSGLEKEAGVRAFIPHALPAWGCAAGKSWDPQSPGPASVECPAWPPWDPQSPGPASVELHRSWTWRLGVPGRPCGTLHRSWAWRLRVPALASSAAPCRERMRNKRPDPSLFLQPALCPRGDSTGSPAQKQQRREPGQMEGPSHLRAGGVGSGEPDRAWRAAGPTKGHLQTSGASTGNAAPRCS